MNHCLYCQKEIKSAKYCNVSCQNKHQNSNRANKTFGTKEKFKVVCFKCNKEFEVEERSKLFPQKEKYFCSRKCANSKQHSQKDKDKIKEGVDNYYKSVGKHRERLCLTCGVDISRKGEKTKYCSSECRPKRKIKEKRINVVKEAKPQFVIKREQSIDPNTKTFIYKLEFPLGNVRYIGKSDNPERRLKDEVKEAKYRKNKNHRDNWLASIEYKPILSIIEETTYSIWQDREMYWIDYYKKAGFDLVNGSSGGEGGNTFEGRHHCQETKDILSVIAKKRVPTAEEKLRVSGENNGRCRLKDSDVEHIFYLVYKEKFTYKEIAKLYNIHKGYVSHLINGRMRKSLVLKLSEKYK